MIGRFFRRSPEFYPGECLTAGHDLGRLHLDGAKKRAIEVGRNRLIVTGAVFLLAYSVVAARMVDVTVMKAAEEERPRVARTARTADLKMTRAEITDRNGILLATSLPTVSLYAKPQEILDPAEAAQKLVKVLPELSRVDVQSKLASGRSFLYLRRNLTPKQQYEVNALGIPGLYFEEGERRVYPHGPLVSHVVGLADLDGKGIAGIEKAFDQTLRGEHREIRTALDIRVQTILRNELARAIVDHKAIGATGMVMDVQTGELLAMVSLPDFDPNNPVGTTSENMFNRATLGVYEMGSTFKLFNTAIAIDSGAASVGKIYDVTQPLRVARFTINDTHPENHPISVADILKVSSNIGSAKMALDYGTETQRAYLGRLGLLKPVSLELPETGSPLVPSPWREINTMTISYGHGIAVTPVHMVSAVASLVNGGIHRPATLLAQEPGSLPPGERVLKTKTSEQMRQLMRLVVEDGTGGKADVPGYFVGGKTGTAEKLGAHGGYKKKSLLSSFIAAFPTTNPRYLVLAMIDEPQGTKETYGFATAGWNAAPTAGRVIAQIGPLLGVEPVGLLPQEKSQMVQSVAHKEPKIADAE